MSMKVSMIAAIAKNLVIGKDNDLAWHLPDDMKYFMNTTKDHYVIMGRKNFESIPAKYRPLPNRTNIIITRQKAYQQPNCIVFNSIEDALAYCKTKGEQEAFIIGGGQIYTAGLNLSDTLYITEVDAEVEGDTYFPEFDRSDWQEVSRIHHPKDEKHVFDFDFVIFDRKSLKN